MLDNYLSSLSSEHNIKIHFFNQIFRYLNRSFNESSSYISHSSTNINYLIDVRRRRLEITEFLPRKFFLKKLFSRFKIRDRDRQSRLSTLIFSINSFSLQHLNLNIKAIYTHNQDDFFHIISLELNHSRHRRSFISIIRICRIQSRFHELA